MNGALWISDREPGIRQLFAELVPDAEVLMPSDLHHRLGGGDRPDALVIDGSQLLELEAPLRDELLQLPRLLICTGLSLNTLSPGLLAGRGVAILAKPFCVEDLEAAIEWLRGVTVRIAPERLGAASRPRLHRVPVAAIAQRRRPRRPPRTRTVR